MSDCVSLWSVGLGQGELWQGALLQARYVLFRCVEFWFVTVRYGRRAMFRFCMASSYEVRFGRQGLVSWGALR